MIEDLVDTNLTMSVADTADSCIRTFLDFDRLGELVGVRTTTNLRRVVLI